MKAMRRILVPIDFSDYSRHALRYASEFVKTFEAKMYLVYVFEPLYTGIEVEFMSGQADIENDIQRLALKELKKLIETEINHELETEILFKVGKPFVKINETASEHDIDLIIISTHGQTGIKHMLFGSTAEKVVRKAPCPVLSLREPTKGFHYEN
jgi:nucleotide-binding universal stress UspA family protein